MADEVEIEENKDGNFEFRQGRISRLFVCLKSMAMIYFVFVAGILCTVLVGWMTDRIAFSDSIQDTQVIIRDLSVANQKLAELEGIKNSIIRQRDDANKNLNKVQGKIVELELEISQLKQMPPAPPAVVPAPQKPAAGTTEAPKQTSGRANPWK